MREFLFAPAEAFGIPVCRLGLASYGRTAIAADDVLLAVERGVNFLNWQGLAEGKTDGDAFTVAVEALGVGRRSVVACVQFWARPQPTAARSEIMFDLDLVRLAFLSLRCREEQWLEFRVWGPGMASAVITPRVRSVVVCDETRADEIDNDVFTLEGV